MKAITIETAGTADVLTLKDISIPPLKPNEVLVKLRYAALNHVDIWVRMGSPAYTISYPHILGADGAGTIEALGAQAEGVEKGDHVVILPAISCGQCSFCRSKKENQCDSFEILGAKRWGTYAEYVVVPDDNIVVIPADFPLDQAAAFPLAYLTAWHMLVGRAKLQKDETLLIVGASAGISVAALQIAKTIGATVYAVTSAADKAARIKTLGPDAIYVPQEGKDYSLWVRELTNGKGADVVFEHVGPATWETSMKSLKKGGRLVTCGATTGPNVALDLRNLFSKDLTLLGARMGTRKEFQDLSQLIFSGKIKPVIDKTFAMSDAASAHRAMEEKKQVGKILLRCGE